MDAFLTPTCDDCSLQMSVPETLPAHQTDAFPTPTLDDDIPLQTSIPETGTIGIGHTAASGNEWGSALKFPIRESGAPPDELDLLLAGEKPEVLLPISLKPMNDNPDRIWCEFTVKLRFYSARWVAIKDYDPYIQSLIKQKRPSYDVAYAFENIIHGLYESAKQLHGDAAIEAVYLRLKETGCTKLCNVMKSLLLSYIK